MSDLTFVNIHGKPVDVFGVGASKPAPKPQSLKRVQDPKKARAHYGFEVVGISQADLDEAKRLDALRRKAKGGSTLESFDVDAWLNKTKPKRALKRAFEIPSSAEQAAEILRAGGGWLRVQVVEILKG